MNLKDNPVFRLGMRTRWRGFRLWWLPLIAAVANLALLVLLLLGLRFFGDWFDKMAAVMPGLSISAAQLVWFYFFSFSAGLASYVVMFIVPALTATTMSREAEAKTLDMLAATKLSPGAIVWGKFFSAVYPILIGFAISIAFGLLALPLGRLPTQSFFGTYAEYLSALFAVGLTGVAVSTFVGRTVPSLVVAYAASLVVIPIIQFVAALPGFAWYMTQALQQARQPGPFSGMVDPAAYLGSPPFMVMMALRILASACVAAGAWYAAVVWIRRRP